jgi:hypothetical protein
LGEGFAPHTVIADNDYRFIVTEELGACEIAPASC